MPAPATCECSPHCCRHRTLSDVAKHDPLANRASEMMMSARTLVQKQFRYSAAPPAPVAK